MVQTTSHPTAERLAAFALGNMTGPDAEAISSHLMECGDCRKVVEAVPPDGLVQRLLPKLAASTCQELDNLTLTHAAQSPAGLADMPAELASYPKFHVLGRLGQGGMGTVYLAEHTLMKRKVALKVMNPLLAQSPGVAERFRREVETSAQLDHPNIVKAHDAETIGGLLVLVMEYVEGKSLDRLLEQNGPLTIRNACHCIREAALGLQHAHEQGMVHRDIKPHNLMLTHEGQIKILDFGLAKLRGNGAGKEFLTTENTMMGTPAYLAPEQANAAAAVDIRADIYSLGCALFHLLAGRPPFRGDGGLAMLLVHHQQTPAPSVTDQRPDVSPALADLVQRMLAKDPAARPQTPKEVADALQEIAEGSGISPEPTAIARKRGFEESHSCCRANWRPLVSTISLDQDRGAPPIRRDWHRGRCGITVEARRRGDRSDRHPAGRGGVRGRD